MSFDLLRLVPAASSPRHLDGVSILLDSWVPLSKSDPVRWVVGRSSLSVLSWVLLLVGVDFVFRVATFRKLWNILVLGLGTIAF